MNFDEMVRLEPNAENMNFLKHSLAAAWSEIITLKEVLKDFKIKVEAHERMFGKRCSVREAEEHKRKGGKFVVYGEPVYSELISPHQWYRAEISKGDIAVIVNKV